MLGVLLLLLPAENFDGFKVILDANAKNRSSLFVHQNIAVRENIVTGIKDYIF